MVADMDKVSRTGGWELLPVTLDIAGHNIYEAKAHKGVDIGNPQNNAREACKALQSSVGLQVYEAVTAATPAAGHVCSAAGALAPGPPPAQHWRCEQPQQTGAGPSGLGRCR